MPVPKHNYEIGVSPWDGKYYIIRGVMNHNEAMSRGISELRKINLEGCVDVMNLDTNITSPIVSDKKRGA